MAKKSTTTRSTLPRRRYKRVSLREWEEQKDRIRELFIDQGRTHEDLVRILREDHSFSIGLRQLKRKTEEWGFMKNIPNTEMELMVRKTRRRKEELGKATKVMRRHGTGQFQEVSQEKLDRFEQRFRPKAVSSISTSADTPSNIIYHTPSNAGGTSRSNNRNSFQSTSPEIIEFNTSVGQVFNDGAIDGLINQANSPSIYSRSPSVTLRCRDPNKVSRSARNNIFDGNYGVAGQKYNLASLLYADNFGLKHWLVVVHEFNAVVMKDAEFAGCPQSIAARIAQELSHFVMRERQKYIQDNPQMTDSIELRKILTALKLTARWLCRLLIQQRAIQIWEPVLGSEHPKIERIYKNIAIMRLRSPVDLDKDTSRIEDDVSVEEGLNPDRLASLHTISDLLHLEETSPNDMLEKLHTLEKSDLAGRELREEIALLRCGRSRAMLGGYYSFLGRYGDAEKAFQDSSRYMKYEVCTEIKLHRLLWYAEHKTRTRDWDNMRMLLRQAHTIYMENEGFSEFIIAHFPHRFELLCSAASRQVPIDEVVNEPSNSNISGRLRSRTSAASVRQNSLQEPSLLPDLMRPPESPFPLSTGEFSSTISVESWRQFVTFSPTMDSALR